MEPNNKNIIVAWDFTILAEFALQHAVKYAGVFKAKIIVLHIVKKEEDIPAIKDQLEKIARENQLSSGIETVGTIKVGSIFNTISYYAEEMESEMVIMGTHGIKGIQRYVGSWALKVIANTQVPFLVIQDPPKKGLFNTMLYPINFRKENKETLNWIIHFSKLFEIKVKIFAARYRDRKLKKGVSSNVLFAQKILQKKGIRFEHEFCSQRGSFPKLVVEYAKQINPDVILVMTTRDISIADFLIGANEQFIIANSEKIPVLCLSPRPIKNVGGFMAGGG